MNALKIVFLAAILAVLVCICGMLLHFRSVDELRRQQVANEFIRMEEKQKSDDERAKKWERYDEFSKKYVENMTDADKAAMDKDVDAWRENLKRLFEEQEIKNGFTKKTSAQK